MTTRLDITRAALLLVDLQRDLLHGQGALVRSDFSDLNNDNRATLLGNGTSSSESCARLGDPSSGLRQFFEPTVLTMGLPTPGSTRDFVPRVHFWWREAGARS